MQNAGRAAIILCTLVLPACTTAGDAGMHLAPEKQSVFYVATTGLDSNPGTLQRPFRTIQHGLNVARAPGDRVEVRGGTYVEGVSFPADGSASAPIVLTNYPNERPAISGKGGSVQELVRIYDRSHVAISGFDIGNLDAKDPFKSGAIFVDGYGDDIQVANNTVHDVAPPPGKYANGRAIQVRGFFADRPLTNVVVRANVIARCVAQDGNVLEVSGNASGVKVIDNVLRDNGGAALNITGGTKPPYYTRWKLHVRNVTVAGNHISATTGKYALGLYVQASQDVRVLDNTVTTSVYGIYVASEYPGVNSQSITISGNVVTDNAKAGVWIGTPYHPTTVMGATVTGNIAERNGAGDGENLGIGRAENVTVTGNQFVAADTIELLDLGKPYVNVTLDKNCYDDPGHQPAAAIYQYEGKTYTGFDTYRAATHQDARSTFGPPCGGG
ncbi:MAG: right-handed parallel beta-helix repeat-containing protein [Candidatus Eremiobacteraeota bacterium]|nr:right-handed parallel beta-helix repeat-containing protein [Candidatus Eremiobacteraeota bacterium]